MDAPPPLFCARTRARCLSPGAPLADRLTWDIDGVRGVAVPPAELAGLVDMGFPEAKASAALVAAIKLGAGQSLAVE